MGKHTATYKRTGRQYLPEEILSLIPKKKWAARPTKEERRVELDGDMVGIRSKRLWTFANRGLKCACCGIEGAYFVKERHRYGQTKRFHLNLYALDKDGEEVMMTSDHVIPRAKGGGDGVKNRQTLCVCCNGIKADQDISNGHLRGEIKKRGVELHAIKPKRKRTNRIANNREFVELDRKRGKSDC